MLSVANHFTIIIPSYNNEQWAKKCLDSALTQNYDNYDVVYINDCSTDDTAGVVDQIINETETKAEVRVINNEVNRKALYNLYHQIGAAKKGSIIVTLDGDDWLPNDGILNHLNKVYESEDIWMTAGSYIDNIAGMVGCPSIVDGYWLGNIRMKTWTISHLRTFRRELFMKIKYEDLIDNDDYFYKFTFDQAMMYPMAEMSGPDHFREIKKVMYVYNRQNPISVDRVHRHDQLRIEKQIRFKDEYERLESLSV
tara:strand:- start:1502 stop:2260 length:759 start_codon:yes stop_codon:yes gene_type:complete